MTARSEEIEEEADCVNAAVHTVDKTGTTSDQKFSFVTKSLPPLAVCWVTLIIIMSLRIYFTSVMSENNTKLTAENQQLKTLMQHLNELKESNNTNVTEENKNLKTQNQDLKTQNQQLETQNQELERQKNNLTEKIQDMETKQNELNVSRAQWSIDAYCPKKYNTRRCDSCQDGWRSSQSRCYAINDARPSDRKTWDEAQAYCKGRISDLAVIDSQEEKTFIRDNSWYSSGTNGYWIGLRAEDRKWKWVDRSDLTETSWIRRHPPTDGHCAISVQYEEWKSVNCGDRKMWICEKAAVSV